MAALPDWLYQRAQATPERLAVVFEGEAWTFRELEARAARAAAGLRAWGVRPGERVAVLARNSSGYVTAVHAISRAGAVLVPLNTRLTAAELAWQVADAGVRWVLADDAHAAVAAALTPAQWRPLTGGWAEAAPPLAPEGPRDAEALHSLLYTSGTTGQPKAAMLTYGNHWWSAIGSALNLGLRADDRWLACLPLFHVGGLAILLRGAIYGMTVIVHPGFDPGAVNTALEAQAVTHLSVVSAMLQRLLAARGEQPFPNTLRCVLLGGGPAPRALLEACAARKAPVVQTYGLTEAASQVATLAPEEALRKLGAAGKPLLPTEVRIENPDEAGVGEILVRGPTVTPGYAGRPEATAQALRDGWLHTGDLGRLDDEGFLYVLDRRDDLIISGGENVYPAEVEAVLLAHPAVAEAGVAGLPDDRWGQVPAAWVVLRPGGEATPTDLLAHCAAQLARYKLPVHVRLVAALPRNASGKLVRRRLVEAGGPGPDLPASGPQPSTR